MSFFRHREIFRSDLFESFRERRQRRSRPHRLDEFPVGYSLADCSPAGSASASPTVDHSALMSSCRSILFHRTVNTVLTVCLSSGDHRRIVLSLFFKERLSNFGRLTIARRAVFDVRPNGIVKSDLPKSQCLKDRRIWAADPLRVRVSGSP
jgi:hypothetical protein